MSYLAEYTISVNADSFFENVKNYRSLRKVKKALKWHISLYESCKLYS